MEQGKLPGDFDYQTAISRLVDFGAALIVQSRGGASLHMLNSKATRNAQLVLFAGQAQFTN